VIDECVIAYLISLETGVGGNILEITESDVEGVVAGEFVVGGSYVGGEIHLGLNEEINNRDGILCNELIISSQTTHQLL
jgi:hypothetical protein